MRHLREGPKAKYSPPPSLEERDRRGKISFEQIVSQVRSDLDHTRRLLRLLRDKVDSEAGIDEETHRWIYDTFLDRLYETNAKIKRSVVQLGLTSHGVDLRNIDTSLDNVKNCAEMLTTGLGIKHSMSQLGDLLDKYIGWAEDTISDCRRALHELGWHLAESIRSIDYSIEQRKTFVTARDELGNAKVAVETADWDDVSNHLRSSMELAIKEKFGFKKIMMRQFVQDAEIFGLPLPSYDSLYHYYKMGSSRLHSGAVSPPFEARESLRFATNLIDELDLITVDSSAVDAFKKKSKSVR